MVEMSRRTFVRVGTVAAVTAAVPVENVLTASAHDATVQVPELAAFQRLVGTEFTLESGFAVRRLRLLEAVARPPRAQVSGSGTAFSLLFRGSTADRLPSATYALRNPAMGRMLLFLGPVGPGRNYEAVVNRWRPTSVRS